MEAAHQRSRILAKGQSKGGCATCKSRRVKCDEIKPHCLRCFQSRIQCAGYQEKATQPRNPYVSTLGTGIMVTSSSQTTNNPTAFEAYLDPALLSYTGLNSLLEFEDNFCSVGQKAWKHLLGRYANASSGARAACIGYGAAKELQACSPDMLSYLKDIYHRHYGLAVSLLRNDLENIATRLPSVFVTCLLLCSMELLFRRRQNALKHIYAVFRVARTECDILCSPTSDTPPNIDALSLEPRILSDFHLLLHIIDIQILSYSSGTRLASMEVSQLDTLDWYTLTQDIDDCDEGYIIHVIHASYAFIADAARNVAFTASTEMCIQNRNRLLKILEHGTSLLDSALLNKQKLSQRSGLIILRNFCLALSALLANLFCKSEQGWATESIKFQEIITSAEELLASSSIESRSSRGHQEVKFMPQLGIIPPLYLAALKYRDSAWRLRAVRSLRCAGLEGPWNGVMCAAVAGRCVEIEESTHNHIPSEQSMVSLCFAMDDNGENDGRVWPSSAHGSTVMKVYRRIRPAALVDALLPSSAHFNKDLCTDTGHSLDPKVWEHWQERIEFSPARYQLCTS